MPLGQRRRLSRRRGPLGLAAGAFAALTATASPARAEVSFSLSWRGTGACVTEDALRASVAKKLGRSALVDADVAEIRIEGEERALGAGRFEAKVTQRDRRGAVFGTRQLEAQSCPSLLRAATLVVALILDPHGDGARPSEDAAPGGGRANGAPSPTEPSPRGALTSPEPVPRVAPARRTPRVAPPPVIPPAAPLELALGGGFAGRTGAMPSLEASLLATARLERAGSRWSFDWRGLYSFSQTLRDGAASAEFHAIEQQLRVCFAFVRRGPFDLGACGGFAWGAVAPTTRGIGQRNDSWRVIAGPTTALAVALRRGAASTRVDVGLTLPLREYNFLYLGAEGERKLFYSTDSVLLFVSFAALGTISS